MPGLVDATSCRSRKQISSWSRVSATKSVVEAVVAEEGIAGLHEARETPRNAETHVRSEHFSSNIESICGRGRWKLT